MPDQVEEMAKQADDLHRQMYPEQYGDKPPVIPDSLPANEPPIKQPPVDGIQPPVNQPSAPDPNAPPATPPVIPIEPQVIPPADLPTLQKELETANQKYKVLQGKYDAEVPRVIQEKKDLQDLLNKAIATINQFSVKTDGFQPPAPPRVEPGDIPELKISDIAGETMEAIKTDYPDIYDALGKIVEKINDHTSTIAKSVKAVQADQDASLSSSFMSELDRQVPDWRTVKDDPEFARWLEGVEPFTGARLLDLATVAANSKDAVRLAGFYKGFKEAKKGNVNPPVGDTPPIAPVPPAPPVAPGIGDGNIAPPRSGITPPPPIDTTMDSKPITQSFIQQFYNDAVRGVYQGKDDEFNKIETRINKAVKEGKVVRG